MLIYLWGKFEEDFSPNNKDMIGVIEKALIQLCGFLFFSFDESALIHGFSFLSFFFLFSVQNYDQLSSNMSFTTKAKYRL